MNKITLEEYQSLYLDTIKKKDYDLIIENISNRFEYILRYMDPKLKWWDYDNGWERQDGHFQPNKYHYNRESYITFSGLYRFPEPYNSCPDIPIRWLWEDFEKEFDCEVGEEKSKAEKAKLDKIKKRDSLKFQKQQVKESIMKKLTKEELRFIKFK